LVFGSVFSSTNNTFGADMPGGSMDSGGSGGNSNQGGDSGDGDGDGDNRGDDSSDAPLTTDSLTAGGDSDDDSEGVEDNDNNNDNEPTSKDAPVTTDTLTAKKIECPKGQEVSLFSTLCARSKEPSLDFDAIIGIDPDKYGLVASKNNPDGSTTTIFQNKDPTPDKVVRIEKTAFREGTTKVIYVDKYGGTTERRTNSKGNIEEIEKDKDNNLLRTYSCCPKGVAIDSKYSGGKPYQVSKYHGDEKEITKIAPDDSFTQTSFYEPGVYQPTKIVTDYRDPPGRKVTETFDGNVRTVIDYNPQDGWTTSKSTDQRTGSTTTEITKNNPNGSISTKNPDNTITTKNKDGSWFIAFPSSQDGSVKTYHSDGRTTIDKPRINE
jgi:hypothetical protein